MITDPKAIAGELKVVLDKLGWQIAKVVVDVDAGGSYKVDISAVDPKGFTGACAICGAPAAASCTKSCNDDAVADDKVIRYGEDCECGAKFTGAGPGAGHSSWCPWSRP